MNTGYENEPSSQDFPEVRSLSKPQRRVLGVLIEKAYTVPESYPMTLKAVTTGCNQKNNRSPVTNYTEESVLDALEELRELGLVAVVHTESGRTERYRHYARKRFPFSEPQLAIMTELLLRGAQQLGELRTRASRMVPVESLTDLRTELDALLAQGYLRAGGSLDRRGAEVDHNFYASNENASPLGAGSDAPVAADPMPRGTPVSSQRESIPNSVQHELQELKQEVQELREQLRDVQDNLAALRQSLGA